MKILGRFLYAVFFICFTTHGSALSWAGSTNDSGVLLNPVIVSAYRAPATSDHIADQVDVLTAEDLQKLPVHNLAEALKYMPGVDIQDSGPFGQATAVSIRGSNSRQVLVMVDGIPFNTQLSGQANLSRIPIENIQQIDVIKGGASNMWGSSLGGVINVITKPAGTTKRPHGHLITSFAQFAATKNSLDLDGKLGDLGYSTFGSFLHADGNLADSRTEEIKNFTKLKYDFNQTTAIKAEFGYSGAQLRYGPTNTRRIFDQPYISRYGMTELKVDHVDNHLSAAYKYNDQDVTADTYNSSTRALVSSTVSHDLYQGISLNDVQELTSDRLLTTGLDADWHVLKSTNYLQKAEALNTQAPYANLLWQIDDWDFVPGVRYDHNSHFGSQLSPSFGTVYHVPIWEGGLVRAKASRVFSAPPLLWLYNSDPSVLVAPNPDLKAERAMLYEAGVEGPLMVHGLKGKLDLYRSDVKDAIAPVLTNGLFQSRNFKKFVRQGGEARLDYTISDQWSLFTAAAFNDVRNVQDKTIVRDAGITRENFKWGSSYSWPCGLTVHLEGYYNRWSSTPEQANDRKPIWDGRLTEDIHNIFPDVDMELFLNLYNISNSKYWSSPTFPLPGRYVEGGMSLSF